MKIDIVNGHKHPFSGKPFDFCIIGDKTHSHYKNVQIKNTREWTLFKCQWSLFHYLGSPLYTITAAQKQVPQRRETTFLTVSDVPFQLSKQLQRMLQLNQGSLELSKRSPPNIEQYQYNFALERDVLSSNEVASVGWHVEFGVSCLLQSTLALGTPC